MPQKITVHREEKPIYDIVIERDFSALPSLLSNLYKLDNKKVCIVTETNAGPLYAPLLEEILSHLVKELFVFTFPAGEKQKNLDTVQALYRTLISHKLDRGDFLIALGGGVTGDLTGYTAATYLRGIDFVQIPTSLLSQVDSSIGGKTGVDFDEYKNMVGAFHQPRLVYMNLAALQSLPEREYLSGMGEIIKHGMIRDKSYYEWLYTNREAIIKRDLSVLEEMIAASCHIKRSVVEKDPEEKGERALLNFGHTLGHAIEKLMGFSLLHGECVALGMMAAAHLSVQRGNIQADEMDRLSELLKKFSLPVSLSGLSAEDILAASKNDKKMEAGVIKFVLLQDIGNACIDKSVTDKEMTDALNFLMQEAFNG